LADSHRLKPEITAYYYYFLITHVLEISYLLGKNFFRKLKPDIHSAKTIFYKNIVLKTIIYGTKSKKRRKLHGCQSQLVRIRPLNEVEAAGTIGELVVMLLHL